MAKHTKRGPAPVVGVMQQKIFGLPIDRDIIFSNHKDVYKKKIEKRQRDLIIKIPFLKSFLRDGEKILLVTTGHSPPTVFEKMGIGWLFVYLKRSLLVFTNRRIIHIPTTPVYRYRHSIAQIAFGSCGAIDLKGRTLSISYPSTEKVDKFFGIAGKEKKKIRSILKKLSLSDGGTLPAGRIHLCPQCTVPLPRLWRSCPGCQLTFKSATMATLLAICVPGGGYFYVRQPFLGGVAALLEVVLLTGIGSLSSDLLAGINPVTTLLVGTTALFVLGKIVQIIHARVFTAEFLPRRADVALQPLNMQTV